MVWIGGIFVTSDPRARIDRACLPVTFTDSILVAVVQVVHEPYAMGAHEMMLSVEYGCKFTVWKTFYEREQAGQVGQPETSMRPAEIPKPHHGAKETEEVAQTHTSVAVKKERLTEVNITSNPLPSYLDSK